MKFFEKQSAGVKAFAAAYKKRDGWHSPNYVMCVIALVVFCTAVLCGKSVWIPCSRIGNLHLRSVGLAVADAFASFAAETGLDAVVPRAREAFLSASGLSENIAWDSRYFNRRQNQDRESAYVSVRPPASVVSREGREEAAGLPLSADAGVENESDGASASAVGKSGAPPPPSSAFTVHSAANPLRVYMFGDSQVYSLGVGLARLAGKNSPLYVDYLPVHSSGFIRQDYFSWGQKLSDTFSEESYDAGVVMLGMNDYQNFWDDDGRVVVKETPEWEAAYRKKCVSLIDTALLYVPKVYWLGMPVVKGEEYNAHLSYIEKVQHAVASEYSPDILVYVPLRDTIPGEGMPYSDTLVTGEGKRFKIMADDGSHFTVEGGQFIMRPLFDMLCRDFLFSQLPIAHMPE